MPEHLTKAQKDEIEALALRLYDERNPSSLRTINVSKQKCLDDARQMLYPRPPRKR